MSDAATLLPPPPTPVLPVEKEAFSAMFGGGYGAHAGARVTRLLGDWQVGLNDPNDDWILDAGRLSARAWNLIQNDPYARAMIECMVLGILGPSGLEFRSLFELGDGLEDEDTEQGPLEKREHATRKAINAAIAEGSKGFDLDDGGSLTRRDLVAQAVVSMIASGDGYLVRVWRPRPGAALASRWRLVDPERIENPDGKPDSDVLYRGHELDADGVTTAVWVRDRMPASWRGAKPTWQRIPVMAEDGMRSVIHLYRPLRAGALRGVSWFAPLLVLAQHMSKLSEAFIVAKRAAACVPIVMKTDDAAALAAAQQQGSLLGPNFQLRPGMVSLTSVDNEVEIPNWTFQGQDYQQFIDVHLRAFAATWGLPFQFVLHQLTEANLASAQVSLDQADKTFTALQDLVIAHVERPFDETIIRESIARGLLPLTLDEYRLAVVGTYRRPRKADANKQRTREAAHLFIEMGGSLSTAHEEMGYDFEEETEQLAENIALLKAKGIPMELVFARFAAYPIVNPPGKPAPQTGGKPATDSEAA